ncbi:MAG: YlcI/YnfO family protein [Saccharospirillum sp.]
MKTASFPSLRVDPALRQAAEQVLKEGETLSGFLEQSIIAEIRHRQDQQAFIQRGLAAREASRRSGDYYSAEAVNAELEALLAVAEQKGPYQR